MGGTACREASAVKRLKVKLRIQCVLRCFCGPYASVSYPFLISILSPSAPLRLCARMIRSDSLLSPLSLQKWSGDDSAKGVLKGCTSLLLP